MTSFLQDIGQEITMARKAFSMPTTTASRQIGFSENTVDAVNFLGLQKFPQPAAQVLTRKGHS